MPEEIADRSLLESQNRNAQDRRASKSLIPQVAVKHSVQSRCSHCISQ